jgi:small GTP-binding protein
MRGSVVDRAVVVLGYPGVGKSALIIQYVDKQFIPDYCPTIGNTFEKTFRHRRSKIRLKIRDTPGQDQLTMFHPRNCIDVHGYLIVYSVASRYSFEIAKFINDKLLVLLGREDARCVPRVLVGTKSDLKSERVVSREEGARLAEHWGCPFVECSAKLDENVCATFDRLLQEIHNLSGDEVDVPCGVPGNGGTPGIMSSCWEFCCCCFTMCHCTVNWRALRDDHQARLVRATQSVAILVALSSGIGQAALGLAVSLGSCGDGSPFSSEAGQTCYFGWLLLGAGTLALLGSVAGLAGGRSSYRELLALCAILICIAVATQCVGMGVLFDHSRLCEEGSSCRTLLACLLCANFPSVSIVIILLLYFTHAIRNSF